VIEQIVFALAELDFDVEFAGCLLDLGEEQD
jgi:hypothetical protein